MFTWSEPVIAGWFDYAVTFSIIIPSTMSFVSDRAIMFPSRQVAAGSVAQLRHTALLQHASIESFLAYLRERRSARLRRCKRPMFGSRYPTPPGSDDSPAVHCWEERERQSKSVKRTAESVDKCFAGPLGTLRYFGYRKFMTAAYSRLTQQYTKSKLTKPYGVRAEVSDMLQLVVDPGRSSVHAVTCRHPA